MSPTRLPLLPTTPADRLQIARDPTSIDGDSSLYQSILLSKKSKIPLEPRIANQKTVLYLAYGSNLSVETFRGRRGIEPISQVNVYVPELKLTFDLAGIPYVEPCFSGSQYRTTEAISTGKRYQDDEEKADKHTPDSSTDIEKTSLLDLESGSSSHQQDYHKDRWHKPLIGVVYEVTLEDYAHIIATEGAGSSYKDVVTPCFPFPVKEKYNPNDPTPDVPTTQAFMAHTLLSPPKSDYGKYSHVIRPDPSYAQPSARYLKLITDGADELNFPYDYRSYLASIRPYRVTTFRQKAGQAVFLLLIPVFQFILTLTAWFTDEDGIMPGWLARVLGIFRELIWIYYDLISYRMFGDGERTIGDS